MRDFIAVIAILVSGFVMALVLTQRRSMGCYTAQIQNANMLTRQSNEHVRQEIDRAREYNVLVMLELSKMEHRLKPLLHALPEPTDHGQRSA